jgi:cytochrome c biogenesis factor
MIKPLINWIWIGSFVMVLGTLAVMLSSLKQKAITVKDN